MNTKRILFLLIAVLSLAIIFVACEGPMGPSGEDGTQGPPGEDGGELYDVPPNLSSGTLDVQIHNLGWNIRGVDNFPSITLQVSVQNSSGNYVNGLVPADFFNVIDEDGTAMWPIHVQAIGGISDSAKVDVVFVLDNTGSMGSYITSVSNNIQNFADLLLASDIDFRIGAVTFGDNYGNTNTPLPGMTVYPSIQERPYFAPSTDVVAFKNFIDGMGIPGGDDWPENPIDTLDYTLTTSSISNPEGSFQNQVSFSYRADAKKIFILITDASFNTPSSPGDVAKWYEPGGPYNSPVYNTLSDITNKMKIANVTVHTVTSSSSSNNKEEYEQLANETGGLWFNINGSFSTILDTIGTTAFSNYVITYMTRNWDAGTSRNVRIAVNSSSGQGQAINSYTAPASVPFSLMSVNDWSPNVAPFLSVERVETNY